MKNLSDGKKCILLLVLTVFMGFLLVFTYMNDESNHHAGIIRLHVIANSDSPADQELKLKVRDAIISYMDYQYAKGSYLPADVSLASAKTCHTSNADTSRDTTTSADFAGSINDVRNYINTHLSQIESVAETVIAENGFDYSATAGLDIRYIPERTYGDITFPAGNYEALCITIGKGKGENWWCVLFPPLCLIDEGTKTVNPTLDSESDDSDDIEVGRLKLYWQVEQLLDRHL